MGLRKIYIRKIIAILTIIPTLLFQSCYIYTKGNLIDYKEIPGTKTLIHLQFDVKTISKPTQEKPSAIFKIERKEKYKINAIPRYQEMKKSLNSLLGLLLIGTAFTLDSWKRTTLLILGTLFLLLPEPPKKPTNKYIEGTPQIITKETSEPANNDEFNTIISFSNQNIYKKIKTDSSGLLNINLADWLANYSFTHANEIINIKILKNNETLYQLPVYVKEISQPCALIKFDKVNVFSKPSAQSKTISTIYKNQIYPITSIQNNWIEIKLNPNLNGYIFIQTAEIIMKILPNE